MCCLPTQAALHVCLRYRLVIVENKLVAAVCVPGFHACLPALANLILGEIELLPPVSQHGLQQGHSVTHGHVCCADRPGTPKMLRKGEGGAQLQQPFKEYSRRWCQLQGPWLRVTSTVHHLTDRRQTNVMQTHHELMFGNMHLSWLAHSAAVLLELGSATCTTASRSSQSRDSVSGACRDIQCAGSQSL